MLAASVLCAAALASTGTPIHPVLSPVGPAEIVWNRTRDACPETKWVQRQHKNVLCEEPDSMPLAWHNPLTNRSYLIAATDCTYAAVGPSLAAVSGPHDCTRRPYTAVNDSRPWSYANHQWLQSTRVFPNGSGFALIHNEFHGEMEHNKSYCSYDSKTDSGQCIEWSTDLGATTDGGVTWHQTHAPLITLPRKYVKDAAIAGYGELGAIIRNEHDGYYYAHVARSYRNNTDAGPRNTVGGGSCVVRTADPFDPSSFRGWNGTSWGTRWANPYSVPPPTSADLQLRTCAAVDQGGDTSAHINPKRFAGRLAQIEGWPSHVLLAWPKGKSRPRVAYSFPASSGAPDGPAPFTAWESPTYLDLSGWFDPCMGIEGLDFMYPNLIDHDSPFDLISGHSTGVTTAAAEEGDLARSDGLSYTLIANKSLHIYAIMERRYTQIGRKGSDGTYLYRKDAAHELYHFQGAWVLGLRGVKRFYTAPKDDPKRGVGVPYLWAHSRCKGEEVPTVACID